MKRNIVALVAGLLFGFGLAVSHLVEPTKVLAFLDVAGNWDPSLLLVMAAGVAALAAGSLTYKWLSEGGLRGLSGATQQR